MNEQEIWLRTSQVGRLSSQHALKLVHTLKKINRVNVSVLRDCGLNDVQQLQFMKVPNHRITSALKWLENSKHSLIFLDSLEYPFLLKQIHKPPLVLFAKGQCALLSTIQVAVIGSRTASEYGKVWSEKFVKAFTSYGHTITSGLALGIDGICHKAALENNGKTIAVLGSGLANIYPKQHYGLAERIIENGVLLSEYFPDTPPLPKQFPQRNRIISGLSKAVVVIEAGVKSGSLITARYAIEHNRDLFTLPAPLGNEAYSGNHWLLQQGAYPLVSPEDILQHIECGLEWLPNQLTVQEKPILSMDESNLLNLLELHPIPVDIIAERMQISIAQAISMLTEMEIKGMINSTAGGYIRLN